MEDTSMTQGQTEQVQSVPQAVPAALAATPNLGVPSTTLGNLTASNQSGMLPYHLKFADFHEGYVARYIGLADGKATLVFGLASGLLAYILGRKDIVELLYKTEWAPLSWFAVAVVSALATSAFCAVRVIVPRLFTSTAKGLVFFGSVANFAKADDFVEAVSKTDEAALTHARISHCYDLSRVCIRKYWWLRISLWIGFVAVAGVGILLVMQPPR